MITSTMRVTTRRRRFAIFTERFDDPRAIVRGMPARGKSYPASELWTGRDLDFSRVGREKTKCLRGLGLSRGRRPNVGQWRRSIQEPNAEVLPNIVSFEQSGKPQVGYWIGKEYWGKGLATRALTEFLGLVKARPLYARAAKDNIASIRVLEKCRFTISGEGKGFSNARGEEVEEFILKLGTNERDVAS